MYLTSCAVNIGPSLFFVSLLLGLWVPVPSMERLVLLERRSLSLFFVHDLDDARVALVLSWRALLPTKVSGMTLVVKWPEVS